MRDCEQELGGHRPACSAASCGGRQAALRAPLCAVLVAAEEGKAAVVRGARFKEAHNPQFTRALEFGTPTEISEPIRYTELFGGTNAVSFPLPFLTEIFRFRIVSESNRFRFTIS